MGHFTVTMGFAIPGLLFTSGLPGPHGACMVHRAILLNSIRETEKLCAKLPFWIHLSQIGFKKCITRVVAEVCLRTLICTE